MQLCILIHIHKNTQMWFALPSQVLGLTQLTGVFLMHLYHTNLYRMKERVEAGREGRREGDRKKKSGPKTDIEHDSAEINVGHNFQILMRGWWNILMFPGVNIIKVINSMDFNVNLHTALHCPHVLYNHRTHKHQRTSSEGKFQAWRPAPKLVRYCMSPAARNSCCYSQGTLLLQEYEMGTHVPSAFQLPEGMGLEGILCG